MGAAKDWILLSNVFDSSHIRNKVTYDFARELEVAYSRRHSGWTCTETENTSVYIC